MSVKPVYFDYSATTPVDPRVVDKMVPWLYEHFGNPASRSSAAERDCARRARRSHRSAGTCTIPSDASPCIRYPSASFKASATARPQPLESDGRKTTHGKKILLFGIEEEDRPKKR